MANFNQKFQHKIISLIFFLFLFPLVKINSQSGGAQSLEMANKWIYFHYATPINNYYTYKEIVGDTVINSIQYAIVKQNESYSYQRADSDKVYYYNPQDSTENISLNYSLNIGDTINPNPENFSYVTNKSTTNIWGKTLRKICIYTSYYFFSSSTNWYTEWIGLTSGEGHIPGIAYTVTLLAANIENNIYGDTTLLDINSKENEILSDFKLYQNYPNPFNPNTIISFEVPTSGNVSIKIYDLLGRLLEMENYNYATAGRYEVNFDGTHYSSGLYIYIIEFEDRIQSRKMLLLK